MPQALLQGPHSLPPKAVGSPGGLQAQTLHFQACKRLARLQWQLARPAPEACKHQQAAGSAGAAAAAPLQQQGQRNGTRSTTAAAGAAQRHAATVRRLQPPTHSATRPAARSCVLPSKNCGGGGHGRGRCCEQLQRGCHPLTAKRGPMAPLADQAGRWAHASCASPRLREQERPHPNMDRKPPHLPSVVEFQPRLRQLHPVGVHVVNR